MATVGDGLSVTMATVNWFNQFGWLIVSIENVLTRYSVHSVHSVHFVHSVQCVAGNDDR